jgi:26S proteasome regulatory subunit N11
MDRLQRIFGGGGMGMGTTTGADVPIVDTSEMIHISSLALLKVGT